MSAEADFRAALVGYAPLTELVGSRVSMNAIEQDKATPYVVFTASHDYEYTLSNELVSDRVTFEVQCWAKSSLEAAQVASMVIAASMQVCDVVVKREASYEPELGLDGELLLIEWLI